jgi:transketolase N-terminal domain/subunit
MNESLTSINKTLLLKECSLRLLDQSFKYKSHHLGSAFSSLPIILEVYENFSETDKFVLSSGHASSALYVVLERIKNRDSSILFETMGEHPHRNKEWGIDCSTGSLGMGVSVAVGMAIANRGERVNCLVSDGECSEGVFWESIRFSKYANLDNLNIHVNLNGWAGYDEVNTDELAKEISAVNSSVRLNFNSNFPFEKFGLRGHYMTLNKEMYEEARERICEKYS